MAYSKQTWKDNDPSTPLSAARLTHIEDGIAAIELTPGPKGEDGAPGATTLAALTDVHVVTETPLSPEAGHLYLITGV